MSKLKIIRQFLQHILGAIIIMILFGPIAGYLVHAIFNVPLDKCVIIAYVIGLVLGIYWIRMKYAKLKK
ncbi:MAG: hypothetical protein HN936_05000 [Bacteroidetes bacterium]|jgi:hypothetical protein|nr:hypothetical protein [Bacteroidota bacterium]MBT4401061.1 hypothetical protein [Bacteroidota bacterium]MBT4410791.1 hypothetical protein [Bacteroidota bacterium]MBT5425111.1 hypothetical protein [Bacteroidota bacterium]MBT7092581.1 hypothetical protein [Bacteroidota bacterium]